MNEKKSLLNSMGGKILLIFIYVCAAAIVAVTLVAKYKSSSALIKQAFNQLESVHKLKENALLDFYQKRHQEIIVTQGYYKIIKNLPILSDYKNKRRDPTYLNAKGMVGNQIKKLLKAYGHYSNVMLVGLSGEVVFVLDDNTIELGEQFDSKIFKKGKTKVYLTDILIHDSRNVQYIVAPIHSRDQYNKKRDLAGLIVLEIELSQINTLMHERTGLGESGETYLVGGDLLMRSASRFEIESTVLKRKVETVAGLSVKKKAKGHGIIKDYRGINVLSVYSNCGFYEKFGADFEWALIVEIDEKEVNKPIRALTLFIVIAAVIVFGIVVIIIAIVFSKRISTPLKHLKYVAEEISQGNFQEKIVNIKADEIGELGSSLNKMNLQLKELFSKNERQTWQTDGLSRIDEIVRGETEIRKVANNLCQFFSKYLNCLIITFYILEDNKLELTGSYAFNKRKSLGDSIDVGEGLVGQAALEKQVISVIDIPDDYTRINSSIGDIKPGNLVVVPFIFNEQVQGVMEIGAFEEISDAKLEFLKSTIEPVGITIHSIKEQLQTKMLLEKTQIQSEELQAQQEELKASNEILEEQTHLLKQSEEELKQQSEELQVSNEDLEEKQEQLKKQKDAVVAAKKEVDIKAQELAAASKYKSEFLANMSHELRTPLNSLLLLSKGLAGNKNGNLNDTEVEDAKIIYEGSNELLELINDIMDLSKVEAGMLGVNIEDVKLDTITRSLYKMFNPIADDKGLDFKINIEENLPEIIRSDNQRIQQILKNFLSNAMKFTENGSVTCKIMQPGPDVRLKHSNLSIDTAIAFSVIDTGIGIPDDKQLAIFESFQQQDGSTSRKYGGTGLGLTISKELAHLLGGEIQLLSRQFEGSTFTLYLPKELKQESIEQARTELPLLSPVKENTIKRQDKPLEANPSTQSNVQFIPDDRKDILKGDKSILIIDDDKNIAKILRDFVRNDSYKSLVAGDGRSGVLLAKEYDPCGILLDVGLPDIDGLQVLEQLKFSLETRHIPVQIISGYDHEQSKFIDQGALGYLQKPVNEEQLNTVLDKIAEITKSNIRNVLVIEDDEGSRRGITRLLENSNINIKCVGTGSEGCSEVLSKKYDCVILDLSLPDMTGFDVLDKINNDKSNGLPPVIIYTGKDITDKEQTELEKYSASTVIKSSGSPERLLDDVSLFLHNVEYKNKNECKETIRMLHNEDEMLKDRKILLVDDDMRNTYALSKELIDIGLNVEMAKNGQEAVDLLEKDHSYEMVLMDIMMPVMDGYEATERIRKMQEYRDIPIITLTAKAMSDERNKCMEAGASEYLTKPIDLDKLMSLLRIWLFKKQ
ncbi:MAG: response regulator [Candidatus Brocadiaceae bacterium]|nr:response regulator [Candidatus Brocadiaceae bacterium]